MVVPKCKLGPPDSIDCGKLELHSPTHSDAVRHKQQANENTQKHRLGLSGSVDED